MYTNFLSIYLDMLTTLRTIKKRVGLRIAEGSELIGHWCGKARWGYRRDKDMSVSINEPVLDLSLEVG